MYCNKCGNELLEDSNFCGKCRNKINYEEEEEATNTVSRNLKSNNNKENLTENKDGTAITALVLGIIGLIAWIIPIIGLPITIVGLILGIKGNKGFRKGFATIGMVLSIIGLLGTVINGSIGAYQGATGKSFYGIFKTGVNGTDSAGKVVFCESVDKNLQPVNASITFSTGQIYAQVISKTAFESTKIKITIYAINGGIESIFDNAEKSVNQDWNTAAFPISFPLAGKYKVKFTRVSDDVSLGEGIVNIQNMEKSDSLTTQTLTEKDVKVPELLGKLRTDVEQTIKSLGLKLVVGDHEASDEPEGTIIESNIKAGNIVSEGTTIRVKISDGRNASVVRDLTSEPKSAAEDAIRSDGFIVGKETQEYSNTIEQGLVVRQSPEADTLYEKGGKIDIVISQGKRLLTNSNTNNSPISLGNFVFPNSNNVLLTESEVKAVSKEKLGIARNEIFARHGYVFTSQIYKDYFKSKSWYVPNSSFKGSDEELNKIEIANIQMIKKFEEE